MYKTIMKGRNFETPHDHILRDWIRKPPPLEKRICTFLLAMTRPRHYVIRISFLWGQIMLNCLNQTWRCSGDVAKWTCLCPRKKTNEPGFCSVRKFRLKGWTRKQIWCQSDYKSAKLKDSRVLEGWRHLWAPCILVSVFLTFRAGSGASLYSWQPTSLVGFNTDREFCHNLQSITWTLWC